MMAGEIEVVTYRELDREMGPFPSAHAGTQLIVGFDTDIYTVFRIDTI